MDSAHPGARHYDDDDNDAGVVHDVGHPLVHPDTKDKPHNTNIIKDPVFNADRLYRCVAGGPVVVHDVLCHRDGVRHHT